MVRNLAVRTGAEMNKEVNRPHENERTRKKERKKEKDPVLRQFFGSLYTTKLEALMSDIWDFPIQNNVSPVVCIYMVDILDLE